MPHYDGGEIPQFVTFRLAGSLPEELLVSWREESMAPGGVGLQRRIEAYLDQGRGGTLLSNPLVAGMVSGALSCFDGERYHLHAWVIMPNHVHVLFTPLHGSVSDIVHSWKSFTAKKANRILGRDGRFWQEDYFDRYIRDENHFNATVEYIRQNPVKAGLCHAPHDWPHLRVSTVWNAGVPPAPTSVAALRREYTRAGLAESDVAPDPVEQFRRWFDETLAANLHEPNAMTVATATPDGRPSARVVLLKGFDGRGFVFYTNYEGRKGRELEENPRAALLFYWGELERQVRIEGSVSRVSEEESDAYFTGRPRGSRLGALASEQSRVIESREVLEDRVERLEAEYEGSDVPRPAFWGGYRVEPEVVEFWQGRENRLHDRIVYRRGAGGWRTERLQP